LSKRKITVLLLIITLAASIFVIAGCGQVKSKDSAKHETVTVTFSYPPYGYDSKLEDTFWKKYIAEFEKMNPDIKIDMTVESYDNVYTKWESYFASGDQPDIGYADGVRAVAYGLQGKAMPVNDVIEALGGRDVFTKTADTFLINGNWYAVPNCEATTVLAYRKDLLKAAGYTEPPKTWDELVSMSKALTKNGVYGLGMFHGENLWTQHILCGFMEAAGGKFLDEKGNVVINSPENLQALTFMTDLVKVYKVVPSSACDWNYGDDVNALGAGKIAMDIMWGGYGTLIENMFPKDYQQIGFAILPFGPSGHSGSISGAGGFFIFSKAKHPAEAKKFIEFMSREEISKEWCKISGNVSPFKTVAKDPELMKMEWYKAISDQADTSKFIGFDSPSTPGIDGLKVNCRYSRAVVDVLVNGMTPAQSLKKLHDDNVSALEKAKTH
jgi:multiple sugar transport system substrate-binding protein